MSEGRDTTVGNTNTAQRGTGGGRSKAKAEQDGKGTKTTEEGKSDQMKEEARGRRGYGRRCPSSNRGNGGKQKRRAAIHPAVQTLCVLQSVMGDERGKEMGTKEKSTKEREKGKEREEEEEESGQASRQSDDVRGNPPTLDLRSRATSQTRGLVPIC